MNATADIIGYVAATLTTVAFVPQAIKTWRLRSADGVSLRMYALFALGVALWLVYGLIIRAWPVVAANAVTLALALAILWMRLRYGGR